MAALSPLAQRLNAALPQTQCQRCGYPDCAAYAEAMANEGAAINQCPPGGAEGVARLAALTGQQVTALNPIHGAEGPRSVAVIDENWCIGCTLCLDACPTDAIFGSNKQMHTVIAPYCTGCELCLPACPVDCISLDQVTGEQTGWAAWSAQQAETARKRYEIHSYRANKHKGQSTFLSEKGLFSSPEGTGKRAIVPASAAKRSDSSAPTSSTSMRESSPATGPAHAGQAPEAKSAVIAAALARARARREGREGGK